MWHARIRGQIYQGKQRLFCTPLAHWTAEEVVGFVMAEDRLPLNPVYTKLEHAPAMTHLRDGTWYPREVADGRGYRDWLAYHYPEVIGQYDRAVMVMSRGR